MSAATLERPGTDEAIDLSDLNLLDDKHEHYLCIVCHPGMEQPIGIPFVAWCGRRAIRYKYLPPGTMLADPCPECAKPSRCATCGTYCD